MKLQTIRDCKNLEELRPALAFLTSKMHSMSFGEFHAYRNTITAKAKELGLSFTEINNIAAEMQDKGESK